MNGWRYVVPNAITGLSFLFALGSLVAAQRGALETAGWLIVWCALLDVLDGVVARLLRASSKFGGEFDSLTDLAAFGIAPAFLALQAGAQLGGLDVTDRAYVWLAVCCGVFALSAALRLARFNALPPARSRWFEGVPTTICGGLVGIGAILLARHPQAQALVGAGLLAPALLLLGLAMVSRLAFPKIQRVRSRLLEIVVFGNLAGIYVCGALRVLPEYLFAVAVLFFFGGLLAGLRQRAAGDLSHPLVEP